MTSIQIKCSCRNPRQRHHYVTGKTHHSDKTETWIDRRI